MKIFVFFVFQRPKVKMQDIKIKHHVIYTYKYTTEDIMSLMVL